MKRSLLAEQQNLHGIVLALWMFSASMLTACSKDGVQGSDLFSSFQGLTKVEAISPTAVRLEWSLDPSYSEYRIYQNESVSPVKSETFSTTSVSGLLPNTSYTFYMSGYSEADGEKFFGKSITVKTWERFVGLPKAGLTVASSTSMRLSWTANAAKARYRIYSREREDGEWDFSAPAGTIVGGNQYTLTGLASGATYCFFIVAEYDDGTSEPSTANLAQVNAQAPCEILTSPLTNLPSVKVSSIVPGSFPWFWISGGDPNYLTEIYETASNVRVAAANGNGTVRSFVSSSGQKAYYALVRSQEAVARISVDLEVGSGTVPSQVRMRSLSSSGANGPLFPPVLAGGRGQQNLGGKVMSGDFNCDGHADVAIAAESATPFITDKHFSGMGAVVVYYNWQPPPSVDGQGNIVIPPMELKRTPAPSPNATYPNPLLISYPVTKSDVRLGGALATGNFNGDCFYRSDSSPAGGNCNTLFDGTTSPGEIQKIKSCDDLVVTSEGGYFYTIYGDPLQGLVAGSQSSSAGIDELTCDAFSNTCRTAKYTAPAAYYSMTFGRAVTSGDYNNDGYDDLAVSADHQVENAYQILIYRGSPQGLYPFGHSKSHAIINPTDIPPGNTMGIPVTDSDDFGYSLGTAYNSRNCINNSPAGYIFRSPEPPRRKGYDLTKCDDLVVGAPGRATGRGSIFSCRANLSFPSSDIPQIADWTCQEHYPDPTVLLSQSPSITVRRYGHSVLGVPNQNGFPLAGNVSASLPANALPQVAGAFFVGAPTSTVGSATSAGVVFGYYNTPHSTDYNLGGIQGLLGSSPDGHAVTAINSVPCDARNANITSGILRHCEHQLIYASPTPVNAQFGYALGTVPDRVQDQDPWMPLLAVAAPFRSTYSSTGQLVARTGTVYLFRGDISTFGYDNGNLVTAPRLYVDNALDPNCTANCTWYSGGISPFGPSVVYPLGLTADANFGIGGVAGGSFNGDNFADLIASAPGQAVPSAANGGVYGFFSSQGSFSPSVNTANIAVDQTVSLEGNYRFEDAKIVGDVNGDGYDDLASHINNNGIWVLVIYYGSSSGLVRTPDPSYNAVGRQPLLIRSTDDVGMGREFYRIGDVNGDGFDDLFAIGSKASYIFYGSSSGLIGTVEPDIAPIGKSPLKFALSAVDSICFHCSSYFSDYDDLPVTPEYRHPVQSVVFGDFNSDGYSDFAVRQAVTTNLPVSLVPAGLDYGAPNFGRVVIVYGSPVGPETNRVTGRILISNAGMPADVVVENPCGPARTPSCYVQLLASPDDGDAFGFALAPRQGLNNATSDAFDGLAISDPAANSGNGAVYIYQGSDRGLKPLPIQKLVPRDNNAGFFGFSLAEPGDINKDGYFDLGISSGALGKARLTVFYGGKVGGQNAYFGGSSLGATDYWGAPAIVNNARHLSTANPRPQVILPSNYNASDLMGRGMVGLGDFNKDGYADIAVNVANGDYNLSGLVLSTGYVMIYFGSERGLQSEGTVLSPFPRCHGGTGAVCEPFQIFLPNFVPYEFTTISPDSVGDLNGDGVIDLVIGGVGRNHPSAQAISSGVVYVLY